MTALVVLAATTVVQAYLRIGHEAGGRVVPVRWDAFPVAYAVTSRDVPGATAHDLRHAIDGAFATWGEVPATAVSGRFVGFTAGDPSAEDGMTVVGFQHRPDLERTLGATTFTIDETTGRVLEADVFLNSAFAWSTHPSGEAGKFDVASIVMHEIGHLLGLGHSALGETDLVAGGRRVTGKAAVMFPIAFPPGTTHDRTIDADDRAGLVDIYAGRARRTGSIQGRVTRDGRGVYGAHVTAFNPANGDLVGGFTLAADGRFVIGGVPSGAYVLRVEPLDDAEVDSYFGNGQEVDLGFRPAFASRLVTVPAGGTTTSIDIAVESR